MLVFRALADKLTTQDVATSPEILFFTLMVSASALRDLNEVAGSVGWTLSFRILETMLFSGALFSAIFYGALLYGSIVGPESLIFQLRLLPVSISLAVWFFLLSTIVEAVVGRRESKMGRTNYVREDS
jgi:hypothetical protein